MITFTSGSTVENFFAMGIPWPENCIGACIGPVTSKTLRELGQEPGVEARDHSIPGLVEVILEKFSKG